MHLRSAVVAVLVLALGVPFVLGCTIAGYRLARAVAGPAELPTLLRPGTQGAIAGGLLGVAMVVAARRNLFPLPRRAPSGGN